mgnify:CR=1 FL=1
MIASLVLHIEQRSIGLPGLGHDIQGIEAGGVNGEAAVRADCNAAGDPLHLAGGPDALDQLQSVGLVCRFQAADRQGVRSGMDAGHAILLRKLAVHGDNRLIFIDDLNIADRLPDVPGSILYCVGNGIDAHGVKQHTGIVVSQCIRLNFDVIPCGDARIQQSFQLICCAVLPQADGGRVKADNRQGLVDVIDRKRLGLCVAGAVRGGCDQRIGADGVRVDLALVTQNRVAVIVVAETDIIAETKFRADLVADVLAVIEDVRRGGIDDAVAERLCEFRAENKNGLD